LASPQKANVDQIALTSYDRQAFLAPLITVAAELFYAGHNDRSPHVQGVPLWWSEWGASTSRQIPRHPTHPRLGYSSGLATGILWEACPVAASGPLPRRWWAHSLSQRLAISILGRGADGRGCASTRTAE